MSLAAAVAAAAVFASLLAAGCAGPQGLRPDAPNAAREVTVFAAASLTEALNELAPAFSRRHGGARVTLNFAGSQQLRTQLEQGARADVFISADEPNMDKAVKAGLVEAPRPFVRNRLVLIVPKDNKAGIRSLSDLARKNRLVLGLADVPAGKYARQVLTKAEAVEGSGFAQKVLANLVSEEPNVKQVAVKVALGEADAGFVYATDVTAVVAPNVQVIEIPAAFNTPVTYPLAVVKNAPHPDLARAFSEFLQTPSAQDVLKRYGFLPV